MTNAMPDALPPVRRRDIAIAAALAVAVPPGMIWVATTASQGRPLALTPSLDQACAELGGLMLKLVGMAVFSIVAAAWAALVFLAPAAALGTVAVLALRRSAGVAAMDGIGLRATAILAAFVFSFGGVALAGRLAAWWSLAVDGRWVAILLVGGPLSLVADMAPVSVPFGLAVGGLLAAAGKKGIGAAIVGATALLFLAAPALASIRDQLPGASLLAAAVIFASAALGLGWNRRAVVILGPLAIEFAVFAAVLVTVPHRNLTVEQSAAATVHVSRG
ncbi:MAG: hypothetical protein U1E56_02280 [Bauldia sp.]